MKYTEKIHTKVSKSAKDAIKLAKDKEERAESNMIRVLLNEALKARGYNVE